MKKFRKVFLSIAAALALLSTGAAWAADVTAKKGKGGGTPAITGGTVNGLNYDLPDPGPVSVEHRRRRRGGGGGYGGDGGDGCDAGLGSAIPAALLAAMLPARGAGRKRNRRIM